ncbi:MAG: DUF898 family protein [Bacillota bacterium]
MNESKFDGGILGLIGVNLVAFFITLITLGIALPFAITYKQRWVAKHTIIDGKRLIFKGSGMGLFGTWIKIFLLTIITIGIYGFWAGLTVKKWVVKHTHFQE